jgi:hypothetical protein
MQQVKGQQPFVHGNGGGNSGATNHQGGATAGSPVAWYLRDWQLQAAMAVATTIYDLGA